MSYTRLCPYCRFSIPVEAQVCGHCSNVLPKYEPKSSFWEDLIAIVMVLAVFWAVWSFIFGLIAG